MHRTTPLTREQRAAALDLVDYYESLRRVADAICTGDIVPTSEVCAEVTQLADMAEYKARVFEALTS